MQHLLLFFCLCALGGVVAAAVIAFVALVRTSGISSLQRRLRALELAVDRLDRSLRSLSGGAAAHAPSITHPGEAPAAGPPGPAPEQVRRPHPAALPGVEPPGMPPGARPSTPPATSAAAASDAGGMAAPAARGATGATPGGGGPPRGPLSPATVTKGEPPKTPLQIDWERWIGIRGAAVLGGTVLALAGLLVFQYSIQRGLITPTMRVVTGIVVALACLVGSEWLRGRRYRFTPEAMTGAGVVILYGSFWAAHALYSLIGLGTSFALMVLVTVACCLLSARHESQIIAVLGLVGGFATPLLLQSDVDRPLSLFGYILLLDLGLLAISRSGRWPALGVLSLAGTVLMQALWIIARMGPERLLLGLGILAVFAILFAAAGQLAPAGERRQWLLSQVGAVLAPFVFAVYFASRVDLGPHLYPVAALLALLAGAAGWIGHKQGTAFLGMSAATGCASVVGIWLTRHALTPALAWEVAGVAVLLSAIFHLFAELGPEKPVAEGPSGAAILSAGAFLTELVLASAVSANVPLWPHFAGWLALSILFYRHAMFPGREPLQVLGSLGLGIGLSVYHLAQHEGPQFPGWPSLLGLGVLVSILVQAPALVRRKTLPAPFANHAAAALPTLFLFSLIAAPHLHSIGPTLVLGTDLVLGVLVALAATRLRGGPWYAGGVALTALAHLTWTANRFGVTAGLFPWLDAAMESGGSSGVAESALRGQGGSDPSRSALVALGAGLIAAAFFTAWPFFAGKALARDRWSWYAAALAAPAWFLPLRRLFSLGFGDRFIGAMPLLLAFLALAAASRTRTVWAAADPMRKNFLAWFSAIALSFASVAIPLQLSKEWITIGWALEGLAIAALWRRLNHSGLKYYALALLMGATARLIVNPAVLGYYPRPEVRIVNWLSYTYLVPVAALLASAFLLRGLEVARAQPWEHEVYKAGRPIGSALCALAGILTLFVWINLTIVDWFQAGPTLTLHLAHVPACDMTLSIAWALYALMLLGFGMAGGSSALRWVSLAFLVLTIGKVFLYDLGELRDLYRVASLVGLAVSLLAVSLLYQRFVFRKGREEGA